jgi:hypothetical protein
LSCGIRTVDTVARNRIGCQAINIFLVHLFHDFCKTLLQCLDLEPDTLNERVVEFVDIAYDEVSPKHYKEEEVGAENVV